MSRRKAKREISASACRSSSRILRPTFRRERRALDKGVWPVAGCDEAGRGPLAGPVVAAAVILDPERIPRGLNDSKKLDAADARKALREDLRHRRGRGRLRLDRAHRPRQHPARLAVGAGARGQGAAGAAQAGVRRRQSDRIDCGCDCEAVVSGDALVLSIAAASIVAKVTRDRLMMRLGLAHPGYGFERHMGYSVPEHFAALGPARPDHPPPPVLRAGRGEARCLGRSRLRRPTLG